MLRRLGLPELFGNSRRPAQRCPHPVTRKAQTERFKRKTRKSVLSLVVLPSAVLMDPRRSGPWKQEREMELHALSGYVHIRIVGEEAYICTSGCSGVVPNLGANR